MDVGYIGTGNMGKPMAANLVKAGHAVTVHDKREENTRELLGLGARWADTPQSVALASQITFSSLPGPPEVERWLWARMVSCKERRQDIFTLT